MALNYNEGKKIIKTLEKSRAKLGVCFQNRLNNNNQKAKQIIEEGLLGKIKGIKGLVTWHRNQEYYYKDDWKGFYATNTFSQNSPIEIVTDFEKGSLSLFDDQLIVNKSKESK